MFFEVVLTRRVEIKPEEMGPGMKDRVLKKLKKIVTGSLLPGYGYIVLVKAVLDDIATGHLFLSSGDIDYASGYVKYDVFYKAIILRPICGEVVDAVVTQTNEHGLHASVGPVLIFVSYRKFPRKYLILCLLCLFK